MKCRKLDLVVIKLIKMYYKSEPEEERLSYMGNHCSYVQHLFAAVTFANSTSMQLTRMSFRVEVKPAIITRNVQCLQQNSVHKILFLMI